MVWDGVRLMIVGMFTVFAFLTLLVGLMRASAAFFTANAHLFPDDAPATAGPARSDHDEEVALALALAEAMRRGRGV